VVSFTPRPIYPQGKRPWYPWDRRLAGTQSLSGCGGTTTMTYAKYVFKVKRAHFTDRLYSLQK